MKRKLKKATNWICIRLVGHIPYPDVHQYKVVEHKASLLGFYLGYMNPTNNF